MFLAMNKKMATMKNGKINCSRTIDYIVAGLKENKRFHVTCKLHCM